MRILPIYQSGYSTSTGLVRILDHFLPRHLATYGHESGAALHRPAKTLPVDLLKIRVFLLHLLAV
ncbi:hypothetical protein RSAG8_08128, partial [Rhizoctonia solani AG-8 WAC10335]